MFVDGRMERRRQSRLERLIWADGGIELSLWSLTYDLVDI